MIYQHQLNRILADAQCKHAEIGNKVANLLKKGKVSCANEHVQNMHIVKYYMDTIKRYYPFRYSINTSFKLNVDNPDLKNIRITLTVGSNTIVYEGTGSNSTILNFFRDELSAIGYEVVVYSDYLVAYSSCNDEYSVQLERLDLTDDSSEASISDYTEYLCEILNDRNCITTCELNCILESMYCILNEYCDC